MHLSSLSVVLPVAAGLIVFAFSPVPGPEYDSDYEQLLEEGIEAFYESQWSEAEQIFEELRKRDADDPRSYFFESMIPFWSYFFGEQSDDTARDFLKKSETAIEKSLQALEENPNDTTMVLMLSGLYGYRGLVAAGEENYQTAVRSGVTGYKYTRQLLALDDDDPRALIGKGIFYYMMGSIPSELKWATNIAGFSGDMEQGFELLEQAAEADHYVSNDARMILTYLYQRENLANRAETHISVLTGRYEENIIFQYNHATVLERNNKKDEARKRFERVVGLETDHLSVLKEKSRERLREL